MTSAGPTVLDASAVLAWIYREAGHDRVSARLPGARISSVNWTEVVSAMARHGHPDPARAADAVRALGVDVVDFSAAHAVQAGLLWTRTRTAGLSLGDRACLALADHTPDSVAMTADRAWKDLDVGVTVELIR